MMIKSKKQVLLVVGVVALILLLGGVTYAFFNYTRTGGLNSIGMGKIYFNTTPNQVNETIQLTNHFPMTSTQASAADFASDIIVIEGDTTYPDGMEYLITITDVHNTVNNKVIPINYIATYEAALNDTIGSLSSTYYTSRGGENSLYTLNATGEVENDTRIVVGYITSGETGINGVLTIKAYIDGDRVRISDTYPEDEYNGTPSEWGEGKIVLTTTEWNSLQENNSLSFKIRAVANKGVWVANPGSAPMEITEEDGPTVIVPTATQTVMISTEGDGNLSCTSSNESVATCEINETLGPVVNQTNTGSINLDIDQRDLIVGDIRPSRMVNEENRYANLIIRAMGVGTATITVNQAAGSKYAMPSTLTYEIEVIKQESVMSLSSSGGEITEGESENILITTTGDGTLSCTTSSESIATCNITGNTLIVSGVSEGNATIIVNQQEGITHLAPTSVTYTAIIKPSTRPSTLTLTNNSVDLTYGGSNGENSYSYNGDGVVSCTSSDTTKVTCSVDTTNHKIVVSPVAAATGITVTVSATATVYYFSPTSQTFTVSVAKAPSTCPTTSNYSGTYDGDAHEINVTDDASGGTVYYSSDNSDWSTTNPTRTDAGSQTTYVKVVGDANHSDNTSCDAKTITINQAAGYVNLSATSGSVSCNGTTTFTVSSHHDGGTLTCGTGNSSVATCSVSGTTVTVTGKGAGTTTITVYSAATTNYTQGSNGYSVTGGSCCKNKTYTFHKWRNYYSSFRCPVESDGCNPKGTKSYTVVYRCNGPDHAGPGVSRPCGQCESYTECYKITCSY